MLEVYVVVVDLIEISTNVQVLGETLEMWEQQKKAKKAASKSVDEEWNIRLKANKATLSGFYIIQEPQTTW